MWTKNERWGRHLLVGLVVLLLLAGCVASPQAEETSQPATATPDMPELQCIHQTGRNDFCYAGDRLAGDAALLEKSARNFCLDADKYWCYLFIWREEENVAQKFPLTDAESSSLLARFTSNPNTGIECFQMYSTGDVTYSSGTCK